jgi:hypothetical protein
MRFILIPILLGLGIMTIIIPTATTAQNTLTSRANNPASCEAEGYLAGQDSLFNRELYEACQNINAGFDYIAGFISGCMDGGDSRSVCDNAADAGIGIDAAARENDNDDDNDSGDGDGGDGDGGDGDGGGNGASDGEQDASGDQREGDEEQQ